MQSSSHTSGPIPGRMRRDANHRVDHTGLEPVVIIDFGAREERWPLWTVVLVGTCDGVPATVIDPARPGANRVQHAVRKDGRGAAVRGREHADRRDNYLRL